MAEGTDHDLLKRLLSVEQKIKKKYDRSFFAAFFISLIPVCFGLYQFYLANEFKREDTQTGALLAALKGETPSEICGNLSLLAESGLVNGERLRATEELIAKITRIDSQQFDGGVDEFDCLPRILPATSETISTRVAEPSVTLTERIMSDDECAFDQIELKYTSAHNDGNVREIRNFLEVDGIVFSANSVSASENEREAYSGLIWYYYPESRRCAQAILDGLSETGIEMALRYYTRDGLPSNLPIRIWPNL
mmetsp:Transcript_7498/g.12798  ORF Transcript_7498/g.12798 Transcript_7498/m.12798 type:complete len:251 (-) Transcript_7498:540-1292(-)